MTTTSFFRVSSTGAAVAILLWGCSRESASPVAAGNSLESFLKKLSTNQIALSERLDATTNDSDKSEKTLVQAEELLVKASEILRQNGGTIRNFRRDLHGFMNGDDSDGDLMSARLTFASLQGSLSVYGMVANIAQGVAQTGKEGTDTLITAATQLVQVKKNRETWFSGTESLRDNVQGLRLARNHYVHAYDLLGASFGLVALQMTEDGKSAQSIYKTLEKGRSAFRGATSPRAKEMETWVIGSLEKIKPLATAGPEVASQMQDVITALKKSKAELQEKAAWLDDLASELEGMKK